MRSSEENVRRAQADVQRMTDELRAEQEHSKQMDKVKRGFESQVKELQIRAEEAEAAGLKGGKRAVAKLEQRVSIRIKIHYCNRNVQNISSREI